MNCTWNELEGVMEVPSAKDPDITYVVRHDRTRNDIEPDDPFVGKHVFTVTTPAGDVACETWVLAMSAVKQYENNIGKDPLDRKTKDELRQMIRDLQKG